MLALQPVHVVVLQRRNFPILLGGQPAEDRGARVHDERVDARARHRVDEVGEKFVVVALIDADAAFDRDGQLRALAHALDALGHQRRAAA